MSLSQKVGGSGGSTDFSTVGKVIDKIEVRAGHRIDKLVFYFTDGTLLAVGGNGGSYKGTLVLTGNSLKQVRYRAGTRIDQLTFVQDNGQTTCFGENGGNAGEFVVPTKAHIVGFYGRYGAEVDSIGIIYE